MRLFELRDCFQVESLSSGDHILNVQLAVGKMGLSPGSSCCSSLLPAVHVPTGIDPLPIAQHEDFRDSSGAVKVLAADFQLIDII